MRRRIDPSAMDISALALKVKRSDANRGISDHSAMAGRPRKHPTRPPETPLQELFIKRVREEMVAQGLSENGLAARIKYLPQRTISDVLNTGKVPKLTTVYQIAIALGVHPWELMRPKDGVARSGNVSKLPERYQPIFPTKEQSDSAVKPRRNKSRA